MADEHSGNDTSSSGSPVGDQQPEKIRKAASEAVSEASNLVRDGKEKAKSAAADAALTVTDISKKFLDRQLGTGATTVGHLANSIRVAADSLQRESPVLGGVIRGLANTVDSYADDLKDQTVEQLVHSASDFTRRQPALVFGLAALVGFFTFRTVKNTSAVEVRRRSPSEGTMADFEARREDQ